MAEYVHNGNVIVTEKRRCDWMAYLSENKAVWEAGVSEGSAFLKLVITLTERTTESDLIPVGLASIAAIMGDDYPGGNAKKARVAYDRMKKAMRGECGQLWAIRSMLENTPSEKQPCPLCNGYGWYTTSIGAEVRPCNACGGAGEVD